MGQGVHVGNGAGVHVAVFDFDGRASFATNPSWVGRPLDQLVANQEAFPIPLTEAMACGTPIVTSRANGLEEIAGSAALLVDPRDPDEIATTVQRVLSEPDLAARMAAAGLERARTFSWETCARRTLEILEEAAGCAGQAVRATH